MAPGTPAFFVPLPPLNPAHLYTLTPRPWPAGSQCCSAQPSPGPLQGRPSWGRLQGASWSSTIECLLCPRLGFVRFRDKGPVWEKQWTAGLWGREEGVKAGTGGRWGNYNVEPHFFLKSLLKTCSCPCCLRISD